MAEVRNEVSFWDRYVHEITDVSAARRASAADENHEAEIANQTPRWPEMETAAIEAATPHWDSMATGMSESSATDPPSSPVMSTISRISTSTTSQDSVKSTGSKKMSILKRITWGSRRESVNLSAPAPVMQPVDLRDVGSGKFLAAVDEVSERVAFWGEQGLAIFSFREWVSPITITGIPWPTKVSPLLTMSANCVAAVVGPGEVRVIHLAHQPPHIDELFDCEKNTVHCLAITPDQRHVVCGLHGGTLLVYEVPGPKVFKISIPNRNDEVATLRTVSNGGILAAIRVPMIRDSKRYFAIYIYSIGINNENPKLLWNSYTYDRPDWGANGDISDIDIVYHEQSKMLYINAGGCETSRPQLVTLANPRKPSGVYLSRPGHSTLDVKKAVFTRAGDRVVLTRADGSIYSGSFPGGSGYRDVFVQELRGPGGACGGGTEAVAIWLLGDGRRMAVIQAEAKGESAPAVAHFTEVSL